MTTLLLSGSPSSPSRSTRVLEHVGKQLNALGVQTTSLHIRDLPAQALLNADFSDPELLAAKRLLEQAESVVIATPIYKAAYSGLLKSFLDVLPQDGLRGKTVLPIATAGGQSHFLALDYAFRPILAALSAFQVLPGIYATDAQVVWNEDAGLYLDPALIKRIQDGIGAFHDSLMAQQFIRSMRDRKPELSLRCRA